MGLVKEYGYDMTYLECEISEQKLSELVMCHNEITLGREKTRTGDQIAQEDLGWTPEDIEKANAQIERMR